MNSGYTVFGRSTPVFPKFQPDFPWIGGDLQTLKNTLFWNQLAFEKRHQTRLKFPMSDSTGDTLLGLYDKPPGQTALPLIILVHGLTGCEESRNVVTSAYHFVSEGFPVLRLNLRGAGPSLGTCMQHYHAGRTQDIADVIDGLPEALTKFGIALVGVSLGGNLVLKFVGEDLAPSSVKAAVSICAPINLRIAQQCIMSPRNRLYHHYIVTRMKMDALNGTSNEQKESLIYRLKHVKTVYDFDERIVAIDNGFRDAETYYRTCSSGQFINKIRIPTLLIHAENDPWVPLSMYLERNWAVDGSVSLVISRDGGHVGFHARGLDTPWQNVCISTFLKKELGGY